MARAGGDPEMALYLLADDLVLFTYEVERQDHQIKINMASLEAYQKQKEAAEPGFLTKLSDSTAFKIALFVGGVYLGREMVKVR